MTESITAEDHDDRHHMIDITATQQQSGDPGSTGELNLTNEQNHRMINIEELLND